jgi:hypothetical protein
MEQVPELVRQDAARQLLEQLAFGVPHFAQDAGAEGLQSAASAVAASIFSHEESADTVLGGKIVAGESAKIIVCDGVGVAGSLNGVIPCGAELEDDARRFPHTVGDLDQFADVGFGKAGWGFVRDLYTFAPLLGSGAHLDRTLDDTIREDANGQKVSIDWDVACHDYLESEQIIRDFHIGSPGQFIVLRAAFFDPELWGLSSGSLIIAGDAAGEIDVGDLRYTRTGGPC